MGRPSSTAAARSITAWNSRTRCHSGESAARAAGAGPAVAKARSRTASGAEVRRPVGRDDGLLAHDAPIAVERPRRSRSAPSRGAAAFRILPIIGASIAGSARPFSGSSTLTIQGGASLTEDRIRYGWNYALLVSEGPSER